MDNASKDGNGGMATLERVVAAAFNQRRKMLRAALKGISPAIEDHLRAAGIAPTLAVVGEREARAVATGQVQVAVVAEGHLGLIFVVAAREHDRQQLIALAQGREDLVPAHLRHTKV